MDTDKNELEPQMSLEAETLRQYRAVRESAGSIDRSAVGKLAIAGADRFTWLQGMVSNDMRLLAERRQTRLPACVLDATGHLLSDLVLLDVRADTPHPFASVPGLTGDFVLAELPRENVAKISDIFDRFLITEDVEISDVSDALGCVSLQGPKTSHDAPYDNPIFYAVEADHTGSGGMDLYFASAERETVATDFAFLPVIENEAQELLRIEAGIPKYGVDMDESVIALEANLGPTHISLTKGCYVGQEIIARIDSRGHTNRALTGFVVEEGEPPAFGTKIFPLPTDTEPQPRETGRITSVAVSSPAVGGKPIALGYARHEHRAPGSRLRVGDESRSCVVVVVELPFYQGPVA